MRLDKYLKVSRIIKRRTVAKDASDSGIVLINGKAGKASSKLKLGDILEITFGNKIIKVKVEKLEETMRKEDADSMYAVID